MARISKSTITKLEIIQVASKMFLEKGYSNTSIKMICDELEMSPGNVTFYFRTKEHLLAELVDILCNFQRKMMEKEADEGVSSVMAMCLELSTMVVMCEEDENVKEFLFSAYTGPMGLEIIRNNDAQKAKEVFKDYCPDWTDDQFVEAEVLASGVEYATLMTTEDVLPIEIRISGALNNILGIYQVPEEMRKIKINKVLSMDYRKIGRRVLRNFKKYVEQANEQALIDLLKR